MDAKQMFRDARRHQSEEGDFHEAARIYGRIVHAFPGTEEADMAKIQLQVLISTGMVPSTFALSAKVDPTWEYAPPAMALSGGEDATTGWTPHPRAPSKESRGGATGSDGTRVSKALIDTMRTLITEKGLVRPDEFDPAIETGPHPDANALLESLGREGLLTSRQIERCREEFVAHQRAAAQTIAQAIVTAGFLTPEDGDEGRRSFETALFFRTFHEHLVSEKYLTATQAIDLQKLTASKGPKLLEWTRHLPREKFVALVNEMRARHAEAPRRTLFIALPAAVLVLGFAIYLASGGKAPLEPDCNMNGFGRGTCTFSNTGSRANGACGYITAWCGDILRSRKSSTICSGDVAPRDSKQMDFSVAGFDRITPNYGDWRDTCSFVWISAQD